MNPANQSLPPGYSASDIVPAGGDQPQTSSLPPGYSASDIEPTDNASTSTQPFNTPGGNTYTPGQSVQHSDGTHGEVTGQHPDTGNAVVKWHQGADQFKTGTLVRVDGHSGIVTGKSNNGKVLVDWGDKGISSVSPGDIEAPGGLGSFVAGVGSSLAKTVAGATKMIGQHSTGLDDSQSQINQSTAVNPMSGKLGEMAGDLVQFLAANGIVKAGTGMVTALPAAEQYAQAARITKTLTEHPILARILHAGINGAGAQGAISGVQSGGSPTAAAEGAAAGGALGVAGEFAPEAIGALKSGVQAAKGAIGDAASSAASSVGDTLGDAKNAITSGVRKIWPEKLDVPTPQAFRDSLQPIHDAHVQKIAEAITNSVKDEGLDLQPLNDVSKMPQAASDVLKKEAALNYKQVDEAVEAATGQPGKYQATDKEIENLKRQLRDNSGDKEKAAKIQESLKEQQALQNTQKQAIKDAGLEEVAAKATRLSKKASAMEDFKDKLLGVVRTKGGENVQINPDNFLTSLRNMDNDVTYGANGRLKQAFGDHGQKLIKDSTESAKQIRSAGDAQAELKRQAAAVLKQRKLTRNVALATGAVPAEEIVRHVVN